MLKKDAGRVCRVLLAEDNPSDIAILEQVVRTKKNRFQLEVVTDGEQALAFLRKQPPWHSTWRPDLVVLNINMPKANGWEVLKEMKSDPDLCFLPVAMWTVAQEDHGDYATRAFEMGCSGGFSKPVGSVRMQAQVKAMLEFYWWAWFYPCEVKRDAGRTRCAKN
ncbi:response regulator [Candidatus Bipolaricaulota bacterium]